MCAPCYIIFSNAEILVATQTRGIDVLRVLPTSLDQALVTTSFDTVIYDYLDIFMQLLYLDLKN